MDSTEFDVVIFDEASQIQLEEAIPAVYRSAQVIVVGDDKQLPPTNFFGGSSGNDESIMIDLASRSMRHGTFLIPSETLNLNYPVSVCLWYCYNRLFRLGPLSFLLLLHTSDFTPH